MSPVPVNQLKPTDPTIALMHPTPHDKDKPEAERRARVLVEKKTVINLAEAFA